MQNVSKTKYNKAKADIKLNFNSYINRSNKAQKHEKTKQTKQNKTMTWIKSNRFSDRTIL